MRKRCGALSQTQRKAIALNKETIKLEVKDGALSFFVL